MTKRLQCTARFSLIAGIMPLYLGIEVDDTPEISESIEV